jgi:hypothetical protein
VLINAQERMYIMSCNFVKQVQLLAQARIALNPLSSNHSSVGVCAAV